MGVFGASIAIYIELNPTDLQVSIFGLSQFVSGLLIRWIPPLISLGSSGVAVIVHFRTMKLKKEMTPLLVTNWPPHAERTERDKKITELKNDLDHAEKDRVSKDKHVVQESG